MRALNRLLTGFALSASFLTANAAEAMPIHDFDQLTIKQRGAYTMHMIETAVDLLKAKGDTAAAEKIRDLFDQQSVMTSYVEYINGVRKVTDAHAADPNFKPLEVEHAFCQTLKDNGIIVGVHSLSVAASNFTPPSSSDVAMQTPAPPPPTPGQK
jgi:hypothetical protein